MRKILFFSIMICFLVLLSPSVYAKCLEGKVVIQYDTNGVAKVVRDSGALPEGSSPGFPMIPVALDWDETGAPVIDAEGNTAANCWVRDGEDGPYIYILAEGNTRLIVQNEDPMELWRSGSRQRCSLKVCIPDYIFTSDIPNIHVLLSHSNVNTYVELIMPADIRYMTFELSMGIWTVDDVWVDGEYSLTDYYYQDSIVAMGNPAGDPHDLSVLVKKMIRIDGSEIEEKPPVTAAFPSENETAEERPEIKESVSSAEETQKETGDERGQYFIASEEERESGSVGVWMVFVGLAGMLCYAAIFLIRRRRKR